MLTYKELKRRENAETLRDDLLCVGVFFTAFAVVISTVFAVAIAIL